MIRIFNPTLPNKELIKQAIDEIWPTGYLTNFSKYSHLFEEEIKKHTGAKHVLAISNCDTALKLCVYALDMKSVVVPTFTFNSTWMAVEWNDVTGIIADINPTTLLIDLNYIEEYAKRGFRDFILVNIFGNVYDIDELNTLRDKYNLNILFDSAHSFGSSYKGRKSGNLGYTECFSFSATKVITSGEGGIICTDDDALYNKLKYLRNYGFQGSYDSVYKGCNGKLSELNAVVGYYSVKIFEEIAEKKRRVIEKLKIGLNKKYKFQKITAGVESSYKDFILLDVNYKKVSEVLTKADIQHKRYFFPLHRQTILLDRFFRVCPNADKVYNTSVCIPAHSKLTDEEIDIICGVLNKV